MLVGPASAIEALLAAFSPGWWAPLYQLPVAFAIAYVVLGQQSSGKVSGCKLASAAAICGAAGGLVCGVLSMPQWPLLTLLGIIAMWFITAFTVDRYLGVDLENSNRITAAVCLPIWLVWIVIGAVMVVLRAA